MIGGLVAFMLSALLALTVAAIRYSARVRELEAELASEYFAHHRECAAYEQALSYVCNTRFRVATASPDRECKVGKPGDDGWN